MIAARLAFVSENNYTSYWWRGLRFPGEDLRRGSFWRRRRVPVPLVQQRGFPVAVSKLSAAQLSTDNLKNASVVMLAGVVELGRSQEQALKAFVRGGGGLFITPPAADSVRSAYLARPPLGDLLPLSGLSFIDAGAVFAAGPPYASPITALWNQSGAGSLEGFIVKDYLRGTLRENAVTVLPLADGDPLFTSLSEGTGRVFYSAVPLDGSWSDLPLSPQFVPLVQRTLEWLALQTQTAAQVAPGERWSLPVPAANAGQPFYVATPSQPDEPQLAGEVEFVQGRGLINFSATAEPGPYRVYLDPAGVPVGAFGVNPDEAETDLRPVPVADAPEWAAAALVSGETTGETAGPLTRFLRALPDAWMLLAAAILLVGAIELYLAQRFSRPT